MIVQTRNNQATSLQISRIGNVPAGTFKPADNFLLKGIAVDEDGAPMNIEVTIIPAGQDNPVETIIYPGWNPEICKEVRGVEEGTLQFGY